MQQRQGQAKKDRHVRRKFVLPVTTEHAVSQPSKPMRVLQASKASLGPPDPETPSTMVRCVPATYQGQTAPLRQFEQCLTAFLIMPGREFECYDGAAFRSFPAVAASQNPLQTGPSSHPPLTISRTPRRE
jgi:hypothetical protein